MWAITLSLCRSQKIFWTQSSAPVMFGELGERSLWHPQMTKSTNTEPVDNAGLPVSVCLEDLEYEQSWRCY